MIIVEEQISKGVIENVDKLLVSLVYLAAVRNLTICQTYEQVF